MGCQVRRARIQDIPAVYSLERAYMQEIESGEVERWINGIHLHLRQWISNLPRMFVAVQGGDVVGHCFWEMDGESAVLASIFVVPAWRRHGYGRRLLERFERDAAEKGFARLTLSVFKDNPACFLYIQSGYQPTHTDGRYDYYEKVTTTQRTHF